MKNENGTFDAIRIVALFFGCCLLLGFLWFPQQEILTHIYFYSSMAALWLVPLIPRRMYSSSVTKYVVVVVCLNAVVFTAAHIHKDLGWSSGPDIGAIALRAVQIVISIVLILEPFVREHSARPPNQSLHRTRSGEGEHV